MTAAGWTPSTLYSDKYLRVVEVEYTCEVEGPDKFTVWIRPRERGVRDPTHEVGFQATFTSEDHGFIRATMLARNGFTSLEGVSYDLLMKVGAHTGRAVRSSLLVGDRDVADDRDDQLQEDGIWMWRRLEGAGRAKFDTDARRFFLR